MDQSEFTRLFVSKDTRAMVHRLKGPERTYDQFIAELCRDYEHRSQPASNETGHLDKETNNV